AGRRIVQAENDYRTGAFPDRLGRRDALRESHNVGVPGVRDRTLSRERVAKIGEIAGEQVGGKTVKPGGQARRVRVDFPPEPLPAIVDVIDFELEPARKLALESERQLMAFRDAKVLAQATKESRFAHALLADARVVGGEDLREWQCGQQSFRPGGIGV